MSLATTLAANQTYLANIAAGKASANASTSASSTGGSALSQLSGNVNFFLTMLTTQLKNQDPTQPMDTNQITQQIAELSAVQQQVNTNSNLTSLLSATKQSQFAAAVGYIGQEVQAAGNTGEVVSGQGAFAYSLASAATSTTVTIKNAAGNVVFTGAGTNKAGNNIIVWDGTNSTTGAQEPDGTYTIAVSATDGTGAAITATTQKVGIVSGLQTDSSGNLILNIGDTTVNMSDVTAVRPPSRVSTTTSTGTNNATTGTTSG